MLLIPNNIKRYKMSSVYRIVRVDCEIEGIVPGSVETYGLDLNSMYYRIFNIRVTSLDPNNLSPQLTFWINEKNDNEIGGNTLILQENIPMPFLRDDLNVYGINKEPKESSYRDYIFINFSNIGTSPISKLFFSITIEKLERGF